MGQFYRFNGTGICFAGYGVGGILINLISFKFNTYTFYFYLMMIFICIPSIGFYFVIESPFWYYSKQDIKGLYSCLAKIYHFNHNKEQENEILKEIQTRLMFDGENKILFEKNECLSTHDSFSEIIKEDFPLQK